MTASESEMYLFDPYNNVGPIQSSNVTILDRGAPIKTSLVANIATRLVSEQGDGGER